MLCINTDHETIDVSSACRDVDKKLSGMGMTSENEKKAHSVYLNTCQ